MTKVQKIDSSYHHMVLISDKRVRCLGSDNRTGRLGLGIQWNDKIVEKENKKSKQQGKAI